MHVAMIMSIAKIPLGNDRNWIKEYESTLIKMFR